MATHIWVNIGSGNGLVPGGTKPLTEPMLINHQWSSAAFTWGEFHKKWSIYLSLIGIWKITSWRSQSHHTGVSELKAILLKTLHNRHTNCKVTLSRSLPSTTKHGSHRPWKVLEFECYLENASFFNLPWKLAILLQNRLLSHNKYVYKYSKKIRKGT